MPDKQVHPIGTENAPADYTLPDSAELLLKSVYAKFDGSAAAGPFVPLVRIISDAGSTTDEIPQDTTIAAGASADATWFPRVGAAAATAVAASPVFARAWNDQFSGDPVQIILAGQTKNARFAHAETTDAAVISFSTSVFTNDTAHLNAHGSYIMFVGSHWSVTDDGVTSLIFNVAGGENAFPHLPINPTTSPNFMDGIGSAQSQDFAVRHVTGGGGLESVLLGNQLGTDEAVNQCYFVIVYLPTA